MVYRHLLKLFIIILITLAPISTCAAAGMLSRNIILPENFSISIYADNVPYTRSMALSPGNTLFVGTKKGGKVYAVIDRDGDFIADEIIIIASGLNNPNGVAFHDGDLYVAEVNRIIKFRDIEKNLHHPAPPEIVFTRLPEKNGMV